MRTALLLLLSLPACAATIRFTGQVWAAHGEAGEGFRLVGPDIFAFNVVPSGSALFACNQAECFTYVGSFDRRNDRQRYKGAVVGIAAGDLKVTTPAPLTNGAPASVEGRIEGFAPAPEFWPDGNPRPPDDRGDLLYVLDVSGTGTLQVNSMQDYGNGRVQTSWMAVQFSGTGTVLWEAVATPGASIPEPLGWLMAATGYMTFCFMISLVRRFSARYSRRASGHSMQSAAMSAD
jgi:hypothetical protein